MYVRIVFIYISLLRQNPFYPFPSYTYMYNLVYNKIFFQENVSNNKEKIHIYILLLIGQVLRNKMVAKHWENSLEIKHKRRKPRPASRPQPWTVNQP